MKEIALAKEILRRVGAEQEIRNAAVADKEKRPYYKKLDRQNSKWLKGVFKTHGWPTFSLVGKRAADGVWMMVQHADHDLAFQKESLRLMKKQLKKDPTEVSKIRVAYLTDRILGNEHKPLEFGIMFNVDGLKVTPFPIRDIKNVDKRRREYGIKSTVEGRRNALLRELKKLGAK